MPSCLVVRRDAGTILGPGLLADPQPRPQIRRQRGQRRRHDLAEHPRALAAAGDQQLDRPAGFGRRITCRADREDRRAHRVAGMHRAGLVGGAQPGGLGKAGGDAAGARRQQPVGAAEHRVLLMDQGRQAELRRRQHRRHRRIAAEPDHRRRHQPPQQAPRLHHPDRQLGQTVSRVQRPAAKLAGAHPVDRHPRHRLGERVGAAVGQQMHRAAARHQAARDRLGREQMPAGAAGGEDIDRAHGSSPPSRLRVKASNIPIPSAKASIDDTP